MFASFQIVEPLSIASNVLFLKLRNPVMEVVAAALTAPFRDTVPSRGKSAYTSSANEPVLSAPKSMLTVEPFSLTRLISTYPASHSALRLERLP